MKKIHVLIIGGLALVTAVTREIKRGLDNIDFSNLDFNYKDKNEK